MRSRLIGAVAVLASLAVTAGCSSSDDQQPPVSFNDSPAQVFSGAGSAGRSIQQQVSDAAVEQVNAYYTLMGKLLTSPQGSVDQLKTIAMNPDTTQVLDDLSASALNGDPVLTSSTESVNAARKEKWSGSGKEKVTNSAVTKWAAPSDSSGRATEGVAFVELRACVDVSGFKPTSDGRPAYNPNRKAEHLQKFLVMNPDWPDPEGWRLATQYVKSETPCTAA